MDPEQLGLPDPILEELDRADDGNNRCRGWVWTGNRRRHRCRRKAPFWWPPGEPWWCRSHASSRR